MSATSFSPHILHLPAKSQSKSHTLLLFTGYSRFRPPVWPSSSISLSNDCVYSVTVKLLSRRVKCLTKSTENEQEVESLDGDEEEEVVNSSHNRIVTSSGDSPTLGIREPIYEVVEVQSNGMVSTRKINRRHLLKSSGLRPRDVRSVDPSLWLTNSMPSLLVREHAILLNLGTLRAIAMQERVLLFNYNRKGGKAFIDALLPRLNPKNVIGGPSLPFELEIACCACIIFPDFSFIGSGILCCLCKLLL